LRHVGRNYVLLFNRELVSGARLCLVSAFLDIAKDCPKIRNLPTIFLRSFENVVPDHQTCVMLVIMVTGLWLIH